MSAPHLPIVFEEVHVAAGGTQILHGISLQISSGAPTVLIDLIGGKKVADPLFTGLDECTAANLGKCPAK